MPRHPYTWKRWQVVCSFVAVTAAFVVGLVALQRSTRSAHDVAVNARGIAAVLTRQARSTRELRTEQILALHSAAVVSCQSRHRLTVVMRKLIVRSIRETRDARFPGLTVAQQRAVDHQRAVNVASLEQFLRDLRGADCLGVPRLPVVRPGRYARKR